MQQRTATVTLLYLIKEVELAVRAALDVVVAAEGLTTLQYTALTVLERHPGMTAASLARNSFVRAQTTAVLVAALEDRRLIERRPDPDSRRQVLIFLSEEGRALLGKLREPVAAIEQAMTAGLSAGELSLARRSLTSFRAALAG